MSSYPSDFTLDDILENERVSTFFQPIVSLKTGTIFAFEALVRGLKPDSDDLIAPKELFCQADRKTMALEFDRLCRKKALEHFSEFHANSSAMIFMNINTSVISAGSSEKPQIGTVSRQMGFDPRHIGLELIESRAHSADDLVEFVRHYRDSGFLIVIDDFGSEHSNLDRLIQIHPDIIKIDRNLVTGIADDPYRQSIVKSIHSLAQMTGSLCLAEGVETLEEIRVCHLIGIDLFQGFAIGEPSPDLPTLERQTLDRVAGLQNELHKSVLAALRDKRRLTGDINVLADWLIRQLPSASGDNLDAVFMEFMAMNSEIECIYLLNARGTQISDTITSPFKQDNNRHSIFTPALKGSNHAFKTYFTCFEALGISRYLTDVYLSLASGNLCRTFSIKLANGDGNVGIDSILCMDFLEEAIKTTYARQSS